MSWSKIDMNRPTTSPAFSRSGREAGLIVRRRDAQLRPSRLRSRPLERAADWLDALWEDSFDQLDRRLSS